METIVLHYTFIVHYVYMFLLVCFQGIRLHSFYALQLLMASGISILAISYQLESSFLLTVCGFLFVVLFILPLTLTHLIFKNIKQKKIAKIARYAYIRYLITRAPAHKYEHMLFFGKSLLYKGDYQKTISYAEKLLKDLPENHYHEWIHSLILQAHCLKQNWQQAVTCFENINKKYDPGPLALEKIILAYCELGNVEQAAYLLLKLENDPEKSFFLEELLRSRLYYHTYAGHVKKVEALTTNTSKPEQKYWQGIALSFAGDFKKAQIFLEDAVSQLPQANIFPKLQLARGEQIQKPTLPQDLKHELELWEQKPLPAKTTPSIFFEIKTGFPWITSFIILINFLFFISIEIYASSKIPLHLLNFGGNSFEHVIREGEYWRLISCMFLHSGYFHLAMNLFVLYFFGKMVEHFYQKKGFIWIYFFSGISSAIISLFWHINSNVSLSVGASGAICGLMGANTLYFVTNHKFPMELRRHYAFSFTFIIAAMLAMGFLVPYIDNAAHFGGFLTGIISSGMCLWSKSKHKIWNYFLSLFFAIVVILCMITCKQLYHNLQHKYPERIPSFNHYNLEPSQKVLARYSLPFTWHPFAKEAHYFYDHYGIDENGRRMVYFTIEAFNRSPQWLANLRKEIKIKLSRIDQIQNIKYTNTKNIIVGTNKYKHFQIHYNLSLTMPKSQTKTMISYSENIYLITNSQWIFLLHFSMPKEKIAHYLPMIKETLRRVKIK